jgi:hypothetical protein
VERTRFAYTYLPWPVAAIVFLHESDADWDRLAEMARSGAFGSESPWMSAEQRWLTSGVSLSDLEEFDRRGLQIGDYLAASGFPFTCSVVEPRRHGIERDAPVLLEAWRRALGKRSRRLIASWICEDESILLSSVVRGLASAELRDLVSDWSRSGGYMDLRAFERLVSLRPVDQLILEAAEQVGGSGRYYLTPGQAESSLVGSSPFCMDPAMGCRRIRSAGMISEAGPRSGRSRY